jgi:DNA-binding response OmpR family regulator
MHASNNLFTAQRPGRPPTGGGNIRDTQWHKVMPNSTGGRADFRSAPAIACVNGASAMQETAETKILIAEDDEFLRKSIAKFIKLKGYTTLEAENGHKALALFRKEQPALILTDLSMPVMDGFGLLEEIIMESPKTPVIIFSGVGAKEEIITALRSGAWDYITKPIEDIDFLMNRIERALVQSQMTYGYHETMEHALRKTNEALKKELDARLKLEKMIIHAKREWERMADSLTEMIALLDRRHCVVRANKAMAGMLDKVPAEMIGGTYYLSTQGFDDREGAVQDMLAVLAGVPQKGSFFDDRLQAQFEVNLTPYFDIDENTIIGSVYIARDVTGRLQNGTARPRAGEGTN